MGKSAPAAGGQAVTHREAAPGTLPGAPRAGWPPWVLLLALSLAAAAAATWPLALSPRDAVPRGTEIFDPPLLHGIWSLWWVADRVAHGLQGFWDAPIFYPRRGALAFLDPMALLGAASTPLWLAGLAPALCYNLTLLAVLTLNGVSAGRLALALGSSRAAAGLAAVAAATLPFVAKMSGVLPVLSFFGLLSAVEGLARFSRSGSRGAALLAAAGLAAQWHASEQVALLGAPLVLPAFAAALAARGFSAQAAGRLALALLLAAGLALPTAAPLAAAHRELGFARSEAEVLAGSARVRDFFDRPFTSPHSVPPRESLARDTSGLFPGILLLLLAGAGAVDGLRARRRFSLVLVVGAGLAVLLALGLNAGVPGWRPYAWVRAAVPGFAGLRSPFRAALVFQALLPVLAAQGIDAALRRGRGLPWRCAVLALGLLAAAENLCVPALLFPVPRDPGTPWTAWLRSRPPGTVVAHVPMPASDEVGAFRAEAWRMFRQIDHRTPMLNGYAAWFPPEYDAFQKLLNAEFPSRRSLCALAAAGVDTVVVDRSWPGAGRIAATPAATRMLLPALRDDAVLVFLLGPGPGDCAPAD